MADPPTKLVCAGCGFRPSPDDPLPFRCRDEGKGGDTDHVLTRVIRTRALGNKAQREALFRDTEPNPFIKFRRLFHSYHVGRLRGLEDGDYVNLIRSLDQGIEAIEGRGFRETPFGYENELSRALRFHDEGGVWVKDETGNVGGTHKARHLMAVMIWLELIERVGMIPTGQRVSDLAVSSCGNAALAAALLAKAAGRSLKVFVPPDADPSIVRRLQDLGAEIASCARDRRGSGDPCYNRFREAIGEGAIPFSCQGNVNGFVIEGGQTLAFEIISVLVKTGTVLDRVFVQTGGGALASSCIQALLEAQEAGLVRELPRIHAVQAQGASPLRRAYDRVVERILDRVRREGGNGTGAPRGYEERADLIRRQISTALVGEELRYASTHRSEFMWPWEDEPKSIATAILDDVTYDWHAVIRGMLRTGGYPVVVSEETLREARDLGCKATGISASATGTAGLAGCQDLLRNGVIDPRERIALLFTGVER